VRRLATFQSCPFKQLTSRELGLVGVRRPPLLAGEEALGLIVPHAGGTLPSPTSYSLILPSLPPTQTRSSAASTLRTLATLSGSPDPPGDPPVAVATLETSCPSRLLAAPGGEPGGCLVGEEGSEELVDDEAAREKTGEMSG
jgi:hypothetical protein